MNPQAAIDAIRALAAASGIALDDLAQLTAEPQVRGPQRRVTVEEFVPLVLASLSEGTQRTYRSYLRFFADGWSVPKDQAEAPLTLARKHGLEVSGHAEELPLSRPLPQATGRRPEGEELSHRLLYPGCGARSVDSIGEVDLPVAAKWVQVRAQLQHQARARKRRAAGRHAFDHDGRGARENFVAAMRCFFRLAGGQPDIPVSKADNPAADLKKPRRGSGTRRMLADTEL